MEVRELGDPAAFLAAASPLLLRDEARHNLILGICADERPGFVGWLVEQDGAVVAAAVMTPPFNLVLARPADASAGVFLAHELQQSRAPIPGVTAALPEAEEFAAAWTSGARVELRQGIYRVRDPRPPVGVPGAMRPAAPADRALAIEWWRAFEAEAMPSGAPHDDAAANVDRRLASKDSGFTIWDDGGPVSIAGYGGRTPNGIRIGPVYTPPDLRRRGYASALVAELSRQLIAERGLEHCFLYTDLGNPTANRIYQAIGYELVAESAQYAF